MFINTHSWDKLYDIVWNLSDIPEVKDNDEQLPELTWWQRTVNYFKS
jgi:hypothetical protein